MKGKEGDEEIRIHSILPFNKYVHMHAYDIAKKCVLMLVARAFPKESYL